MKDNLLFIGNFYWCMKIFRSELLLDLKKDYNIFVIADRENDKSQYLESKINFHHVKLPKIGVPLQLYLYAKEIKALVKKINPKIIFTYTLVPNTIGTLFLNHKKIVIITTGLGNAFLQNGIKKNIATFLYKKACKNANQIWFLNTDDQRLFIESEICNSNSTYILPSEGIDINRVSRKSEFKKQNSFLFIGRLIKEKGIYEYVNTSKYFKDINPHVTFNIIGKIYKDNPSSLNEKDIEDFKHYSNINYLGEQSNVFQFIEESDCLILPSTYREGVPMVLLEAMSMSVPIITTDSVGCKEVIDDGINGLKIQPNNDNELISAVQKLIDTSEADLIKMGKAGRKMVEEKYSMSNIIKLYRIKIKSLLTE